jgi:hypothetical protein
LWQNEVCAFGPAWKVGACCRAVRLVPVVQQFGWGDTSHPHGQFVLSRYVVRAWNPSVMSVSAVLALDWYPSVCYDISEIFSVFVPE